MDTSTSSFDSICCVCLEELPIVRQAAGLDCIHKEMFHVYCIEEWLISRRTCPLCRTEVIIQFEIEEPVSPPVIAVATIPDTFPSISKTLFILCIAAFTLLLCIYNMFYLSFISQKGLNFILFVIQFLYGVVMLIFLLTNILEIFVSRIVIINKWDRTSIFINTGFVYSLIVFFSVIR